MPQPALDIVLPCYNPQDCWTQTVIDSYSKICDALAGTKVRLIIVNDGSKKNIAGDLNILKEKIPFLEINSYSDNKGKGYAVRKGVSISTNDVVIYTDIDFPYEEEGLIFVNNEYIKLMYYWLNGF